jgi:H+/Cl- antiporter ClcA
MIDTQARPVSYFRLMALVAVLGVVSALVTFSFIALVHQGTHLLWTEAAAALGLDPRLFTLLVCSIGGLLVGLLVKFFGDHNAIFADLMREFGETGRFNYRNAPGIVVTALVSLVSGASLGPEAPLADACGGIGTWASDRLKLNEQGPRRWDTRASAGCSLPSSLAGRRRGPGLRSAQGGPLERRLFLVLFPSRMLRLRRGDGGLRRAERGFLPDVVCLPRLCARM